MAWRVLVVDDHQRFRSFARRLFEAVSYADAREPGDGASAREAVCELRPDVVLRDVLLPDTTDFELTDELCDGPGGPVVVLTSSRSAADFGGSAERARADGFVAKPDLSALALVLEGAA